MWVPVLYGSAEDTGESKINTLLDAVWKAQEDGPVIQMDDWQVLHLKYVDAPPRADLPNVEKYLLDIYDGRISEAISGLPHESR